MDKTIEIIVVVMVLMLTAGIVMALLGFRVGPFTDFLDNQTEGASCDVKQSQFERACECDGNGNVEEGASPNDYGYDRCADQWDVSSCNDVCS